MTFINIYKFIKGSSSFRYSDKTKFDFTENNDFKCIDYFYDLSTLKIYKWVIKISISTLRSML